MMPLSPAEWFALGFIAGTIASMSAWGAVVFWVDELQAHRRRTDLTALADAVGVFDVEDAPVCEDCTVVLDEANTAVTCSVHDLCVDCDDHSNGCSECRSARFHAGAGGVYDWSAEGWVR